MTEAPGDQRDRSTHAQLIGCAGCGGVVLSILTLLALTVFRSEQVFFDDPAQVTAALQAIVPSELPRGYRPYRGRALDSSGSSRSSPRATGATRCRSPAT